MYLHGVYNKISASTFKSWYTGTGLWSLFISFKFLTNFGHKVDIFFVLLEVVLMGTGNTFKHQMSGDFCTTLYMFVYTCSVFIVIIMLWNSVSNQTSFVGNQLGGMPTPQYCHFCPSIIISEVTSRSQWGF